MPGTTRSVSVNSTGTWHTKVDAQKSSNKDTVAGSGKRNRRKKRLARDPLRWLDDYLPQDSFGTNTRASLDVALQDSILTWNCPRLEDPPAEEFLCCFDISGDVVL